MAITTCNLPTADKRAQVRDLLELYDAEHARIMSIVDLVPSSPIITNVCDTEFTLTISEIIGVFERRKADIEQQLSKLGINLKSQDEQPSASPVLDAAVRSMHAGIADNPQGNLGQVTESVTE